MKVSGIFEAFSISNSEIYMEFLKKVKKYE